MVLGGTGSVYGITGWYLVALGQYRAVMVGTWGNWDTMGRYWPVLGVTGSVWGGTGWYLVALGQYNFVLFGIKWHWVY